MISPSSRRLITRTSGLARKALANFSSPMRSAFCAARSCVWSRKTSTTPIIVPLSSRMGAPLSAIGRSVPSRETSTVWLPRPATSPSRRTRCTGLSAAVRESSFTMWNTSSRLLPAASVSSHPVSRSATGFICLTRPPVSVVITASPILYRVVRNSS